MNSNNRSSKWFDWVVPAVFVVVMCVWWIHFRPLPHTDPWRGIVLHGTLLLMLLFNWLNAYHRGINAGRWSFWGWSVAVGFSIPTFILDLLDLNHMKPLSPLDDIVIIIFGLLTGTGLGFLAERRRIRR